VRVGKSERCKCKKEGRGFLENINKEGKMKKISLVIGGVGVWSLVYGAHNLQVTPTEFFANESFEVSFEFEQEGAAAIGEIYLDINENGAVDKDVDKLLYILKLRDGSCLDEDETVDGKYKERFLPLLSSGKFVLKVEDNGVSEEKGIIVKSIESSYSVSGRVTEPANTKGIYVCLFRITDYDPLQYEFSYGDFTDEQGNYKIGVTENEINTQWHIAIMDIVNIAPSHWSNNLQTDTITINGAEVKDIAMATGSSIPVSGTIKDNNGGNLPHSPLILLGAGHANISGVIDNLRIKVVRANDNGEYSAQLPPFGMVGVYFAGTIAFLRQFYGEYMVPASKREEFVSTPPPSVSINLTSYQVDSNISGKVLINGQPYDGCIVTAKAQDVGTSMGVTCKNGEYKIGVSSVPSTYTVRVDPRSVPQGAQVSPESKEAAPGATEVDFAVGVEESIEFEGLSVVVSTNPVKGEIIFKVPYRKNEVGKLHLYDIAGNCVAKIEGKARGEATEFKINEKMAIGVYFYSITIGKVRVQGKVVKMR